MRKIFFILFMAFASVAFANDNAQLWSKANDLYSMGEYQEALNNYLEIEKGGYDSYKLYYNIGNAYYKLGDKGKSILYYEKALKLNPAGEDAQTNLQIAKLQTLDKIETLPEFILTTWIKGIRNWLSSNAWAYTALALFVITSLLLLAYKFAPTTGQRKLSFVIACITFLFMIFAILFAANLRSNANSEDTAIVMVPVSNIKSAPNATGNNLFILHEGTKIEILETAGQWCRIEIADGRQGWMQKGDIEII